MADPAPHDSGSVHDRFARLLDTAPLAQIVPQLAPETLHELIRYRGLEACGELVTSATPEQLTSVFDLDLWRNSQPGHDEHFDARRFGEWLEVLVETGASEAARIVAGVDVNLMIAGLSRHIRVYDPAMLMAAASTDDGPLDADVRPYEGLSSELGGYMVRATRTDAWDAIVTLLLALDAAHGACFHAIMRGCRRLSDSTPEIDGLDDLLMAPEQLLHDLAAERDDRQSARGYSPATDARAFLHMARRPRPHRPAPFVNPVAAAYFRAADEAAASAHRSAPGQHRALEPSTSATATESIGAVVDLLTEAGLVLDRPRALLEGTAPRPSRARRMESLIEHVHNTDDAACLLRIRELAFLANTLKAGCSVQSRPFTVEEAHEAAVAVCNLGLEHWPARWPSAPTAETHEASRTEGRITLPDTFLMDHDLITAFEVGWALLHEKVSMYVAEHLIVTLTGLQCVDADIQSGLHALRRELMKQRDAGTPWCVRDALDVVGMLDMPAWASLLGLLDECPVLPAALTAIVEGHTGAVSATDFEFISTTGQIGEIRAFMAKVPALLRM